MKFTTIGTIGHIGIYSLLFSYVSVVFKKVLRHITL